MSTLRKTLGRFPLGVWMAIVAILLLFLGWAMQAYSLLNWDHAVDLGLQNERFSGGPAERAWAKESWGVAMADMLWPLPLGIAALAVTQGRAVVGDPTTAEVTIATAHQATGAALLAISVMLALWTRRFFGPPAE